MAFEQCLPEAILAEMQSRFVNIDGPVHYLDFGGDGPPIVCLHGTSSSAACWTGVATRLAVRHRVVAPDFLGHGRTPLDGRRATLADNQRLLDRLLTDLRLDGVVLVSITGGGLVSILEAREQPDRVVGIVLIEPVAVSAGRRLTMGLMFMLLSWPFLADIVGRRVLKLRQGAEAATIAFLKMSCAHPERVDAEQVRALVESARGQLQGPNPMLGVAQNSREAGKILLTGSIDRYYQDLKTPAMIAIGRLPKQYEQLDATAALARRHPDWKFEILDDVRHPPLEAPQQLAELIEAWLSPRKW